MRVGVVVIGVLTALVGGVFAGQGLGYIAGSFMTGDMTWFWIGAAMVAAGAIIVAGAVSRRFGR